VPLVDPAWPSGALPYLGARRLRSGHMMVGGVPRKGGLPPLGLIGPDGNGAPAAVAAQEPAATSKTGETATRGERLIRWPAPGRRPPVPEACGSSRLSFRLTDRAARLAPRRSRTRR